MTTDYLAIILIGGGSSWGRDPDREKAIKAALRSYRDWDQLFDIYNKEVKINVVDVAGYSDCHWGGYSDGWLHGRCETTGRDEAIKRPIEVVSRIFARPRARV